MTIDLTAFLIGYGLGALTFVLGMTAQRRVSRGKSVIPMPELNTDEDEEIREPRLGDYPL